MCGRLPHTIHDGQEILPAYNGETAVRSYMMINNVASETVLKPSMSSDDVKTVVSSEMARTSNDIKAMVQKQKRKQYTMNKLH